MLAKATSSKTALTFSNAHLQDTKPFKTLEEDHKQTKQLEQVQNKEVDKSAVSATRWRPSTSTTSNAALTAKRDKTKHYTKRYQPKLSIDPKQQAQKLAVTMLDFLIVN